MFGIPLGVSWRHSILINSFSLPTTERTQAGLSRRGRLWKGCWGVCLTEPKSRQIAQHHEQLSWSIQLISASPLVTSFFLFFWYRIFSIRNCNTCDQKQPFQLLEMYWSVFLLLLVSSFPGKELIYPARIRCHFWPSQLWSRVGCEEKFWVLSLGNFS